MEQHQGAMHKPLPTALMNKAFKHFQQDQSENSYGCGPGACLSAARAQCVLCMCAAVSRARAWDAPQHASRTHAPWGLAVRTLSGSVHACV